MSSTTGPTSGTPPPTAAIGVASVAGPGAATNGAHSLTAVARDAAGNLTGVTRGVGGTTAASELPAARHTPTRS